MQSEPFAKLFASITESSLWDYPDAIRIVWITMLAMANRDGYVGSSIPGLAARSRTTIEVVEEALRLFMSPDPYSRNVEHEGRRVEKVDRGWLILNFATYRGTDDEDRVRARKRGWWARNRGKTAAAGQTSQPPEADNTTRLDAPSRLPSVSVVLDPLRSGSDPDPDLDLTRAREAEAPSQVRPVLRSGAPLVHWTLDGWELSPELRAEAVTAGVPADEVDGYVEGLRAGPIGGSRGVIDRDGYVRSMFGRWRTWSETARFKRSRQQHTYGEPEGMNLQFGAVCLRALHHALRAAPRHPSPVPSEPRRRRLVGR